MGTTGIFHLIILNTGSVLKSKFKQIDRTELLFGAIAMSPGGRVADTSRYRGRPASYRYSSIRQCIHCGFPLLIIVNV